jgi:hypothetical protein
MIQIKSTSPWTSYGDRQWDPAFSFTRRPFDNCEPMTKLHNHLCRLSVAAASVMLLSAAPSLGQSVPIPCSAFAHPHGGWKILAPVMLAIDGKLLAPTVGTTLAPGSTTNGIKMSEYSTANAASD